MAPGPRPLRDPLPVPRDLRRVVRLRRRSRCPARAAGRSTASACPTTSCARSTATTPGGSCGWRRHDRRAAGGVSGWARGAGSTPARRARGTFAVLALDHRQNLRRELRPDDPAVGHLRRDGRVQAGGRPGPRPGRDRHAARSRDRRGPVHRRRVAARRRRAHRRDRGDRLRRARRRRGSAGSSTAGASRRRSGWARRPPSSSSTTTPMRRTPRTRSGSCRRRGRLPRASISRCSSSRCRSRSSTARRSTGEARRRVVVETARRLTRDRRRHPQGRVPVRRRRSTDRARWREACAELDEASALPWVLLSGGVDDATFEAQVETACRAGASGVLVGRSVWAEAATLAAGGPRRVPRDDRPRPARAAASTSSTRPVGRGTSGPDAPDRPRPSPATAGTGTTDA